MTIVRPITLDDVPGFNAALGSVALERRYLRTTEAPPLERSYGFVAGNIETGNPQFVALDDDVVVGWCDVCRVTDNGSEHVGVLGMGVFASHRGRGIGRQLIEATLADARTRFSRIELDVYASNRAAIALYLSVGFEQEGVRRAAIRIGGRDEDIVVMGLLV